MQARLARGDARGDRDRRGCLAREHTDTVIDPSGRRRELRLPPIRKQIERTPEGLRFTDHRGPG